MAQRKHLDLPMDDDVNISNHGISGKHLLGLGAMVLAGTLGWRALTPGVEAPDLAAPTPVAPQEFEVTFWAEDGTEIEVLPERIE